MSPDELFLKNGIVPLSIKHEGIPRDLVNLYFAWQVLSGKELGAEPWIPVGCLGPILILGHYKPLDVPCPLPEWLCGRSFIAEDAYKQNLRDVLSHEKGTTPPFSVDQVSMPTRSPNRGDLDIVDFLLNHTILEHAHRAALKGFSGDLGLLPEGLREAAIFLKYRCPIVDLRYNVPDDHLIELSPTASGRFKCVCFNQGADYHYIASPWPAGDPQCQSFTDHFRAEIQQAKRIKPQYVLTSREQITNILRAKSGVADYVQRASRSEHGDSVFSAVELSITEDEVKNIDPERTSTTERQIVTWLIGVAIIRGGNNLHLDIFNGQGRYRMEVDGVLEECFKLPMDRHKVLCGIIRDISEMTDAAFVPESKRIGVRFQELSIDIRVEATPLRDGKVPQCFCLRILNNSTKLRTLNDLQMRERELLNIRKLMRHPKGLILFTGPTNSGKSTTIYCGIREINVPSKKIVSAEDPIETIIEGVDQVQVNENNPKLTFASVLRSFLRQAPHVVIIGEIRDRETAEIAVSASLTGHLVIASLHTNSAASAPDRLIEDFEIKRGIVADSLLGMVAQRLLRNLCPQCKISRPPNVEECHAFKIAKLPIPETVFEANTKKRTCPTCYGNGYHGRFAVIETILNTPNFYNGVKRGAGARELLQIAISDGTIPLLTDSLKRVSEGSTSFEQALLAREISQSTDNAYETDGVGPQVEQVVDTQQILSAVIAAMKGEPDLLKGIQDGADLSSLLEIATKNGTIVTLSDILKRLREGQTVLVNKEHTTHGGVQVAIPVPPTTDANNTALNPLTAVAHAA